MGRARGNEGESPESLKSATARRGVGPCRCRRAYVGRHRGVSRPQGFLPNSPYKSRVRTYIYIRAAARSRVYTWFLPATPPALLKPLFRLNLDRFYGFRSPQRISAAAFSLSLTHTHAHAHTRVHIYIRSGPRKRIRPEHPIFSDTHHGNAGGNLNVFRAVIAYYYIFGRVPFAPRFFFSNIRRFVTTFYGRVSLYR